MLDMKKPLEPLDLRHLAKMDQKLMSGSSNSFSSIQDLSSTTSLHNETKIRVSHAWTLRQGRSFFKAMIFRQDSPELPPPLPPS